MASELLSDNADDRYPVETRKHSSRTCEQEKTLADHYLYATGEGCALRLGVDNEKEFVEAVARAERAGMNALLARALDRLAVFDHDR